MKNVYLTLSLLFIFIAVGSFSQSRKDFLGEWKVITQSEDWILKKPAPDTLGYPDWGRFFQFNEDGTYSEYASAPCGLDDNHYRYSGNWSYNVKKRTIIFTNIRIINDRPEIYNKYEVLKTGSLKVLSLKEDELIVHVEKAWEKTSDK